MNSRRSPGHVIATHGSNEIACFLCNERTAHSSMTDLPSPVPLKSLTVPTDDGFRLDDDSEQIANATTSARAKPKDIDQRDRGE